MIALLTGRVVSKTSPNELIVDVAGVGYQVLTTVATLEEAKGISEEITLYIYTHVREDTLSLYGFFTDEEKQLFIKLLKVNGIGPKLALAILSGVPPADFVQAVTSEDMVRLNAIPGVGKKTAERIIVDLKDKLLKMGGMLPCSNSAAAKKSTIYSDALSALTNLGYNQIMAERALGKIGVDNESKLATTIKDALKELTKR